MISDVINSYSLNHLFYGIFGLVISRLVLFFFQKGKGRSLEIIDQLYNTVVLAMRRPRPLDYCTPVAHDLYQSSLF